MRYEPRIASFLVRVLAPTEPRANRLLRRGCAGVALFSVFALVGCAGGNNNSNSPQQPNPQPALTNLSPPSVPVGTTSQMLTINGTGFLASSTVMFNGASHAVTFIGPQQLSIILINTDLASIGNFAVVVTNPPSDGGASAPANFRVQGGTLQVQITGLPGGTSGNVSITSAGGFNATITPSQTFQVPPATYTATANGVLAGNLNYYSTPAQQSINVADGSSNLIQVPYNTQIPTTTKVLDQVGAQSLIVSPDGSTLTMSASSPVAQSLNPGDIVAIDITTATPNGLLRQVVSVSNAGAQIVVVTTQGTLAEAFQQADFQFSTTLSPDNVATSAVRSPGIKVSRRTVEADAISPETALPDPCAGNLAMFMSMKSVIVAQDANGSITANGSVEICPSMTFNWDISGGQLNSLTATATISSDTHINLTGRYDASFAPSNFTLDTINFKPIRVLVGEVPIVLTPTVVLFVGANGQLNAGFSMGETQTATATGGLSYSNGTVSTISNATDAFGEDPTGFDAALSAKIFAGTDITLAVDGLVSPTFAPDEFLQFNADITKVPWWTLTSGLEGSIAVDVGIIGVSSLTKSFGPYDVFAFPTPPHIIAQASGGFTTATASPTLNTVSPPSGTQGGSGVSLSLTGSNFVPGAMVSFNGQPLSTTFTDPNDLNAVLTAKDLCSAGTFPVTVVNPDTPGAISSPINFVVQGTAQGTSTCGAAVYTYTGNPFSSTGNTCGCTRITVTLRFEQPLPPSWYDSGTEIPSQNAPGNPPLTSWTASDGTTTLTSGSVNLGIEYTIQTDLNGAIQSWDVDAMTLGQFGEVLTQIVTRNQGPGATGDGSSGPTGAATIAADPGTWSMVAQ